MSLVNKFKAWLANEVKVDYEAIAVDVKGLAEHVVAEIAEVEAAYDKRLTAIEEDIKKLFATATPVPYPHPSTVEGATIPGNPNVQQAAEQAAEQQIASGTAGA